MSNPSNLYAEKIFSEHPISLWALDDQIDYISLINNSQRHIENWTVTGATATNNSSVIDDPFPTSPTTKFVATVPSTQYGQIKLVSPNIIKFEDLSSAMETFSIGTYVYAANDYSISYEIGYEYTDSVSSNIVEVVKKYQSSIANKWLFISETFKSSKTGNDPEYIRLVLKINYVVLGNPVGGYIFYINGTSFGQWSEEFATVSLGNDVINLPAELASLSSNIDIDQKAIIASAYGLDPSNGYYLTDGHNMFAKNSGVPLVYGASNATILCPNNNGLRPSIVLPGQGFLNNSGRYNDYTAEFWIRLDNRSSSPRRIFGPIVETSYLSDPNSISSLHPDGIYVDGPFVKIKVGESIGSHFIGDWSRPMLFDFKIADGVAGLMVNGEQVISMIIDLKTITLPEEFSYLSTWTTPQDQNWLGFYAYSDIPKIEIDCVALYSYQVSSVLAKRRFAYGQAVEFPEGANTAYGGTSAFIDYPFASYTNNYSYPEVGKFANGIVDNATISSKAISSPSYNLPEVIFQNAGTSITSWNTYNKELSDTVGQPSISFASNSGYLFFEKFNVLKEDVKAVYGIFTPTEYPVSKQSLIKIQNRITGDCLHCYILGTEVFYELKFNNSDPEILYSEGDFVTGEQIFANIDIDYLVSYYGSSLASFFGNRGQLMMYVASTPEFNSNFNGQVNKIGFCTAKNLKPIKKYFNNILSSSSTGYDAGESYYGSLASFWSNALDGGTPGGSFISSELYAHTASYTLIPKNNYGSFELSISTNSYWEDYVPLSFLSQYVHGISGDITYDLDFIQFNIGYPAMPVYNGAAYDTSSSLVKTYVTFKYASEAPSNFEDRYVNTIAAQKNGVVAPGTYITGYTNQTTIVNGQPVVTAVPVYDNFYNTRYEVVDGLIIYPPAGVNVNSLVMATHIVINSDVANTSQVKVKSLQYASESFNSYVPNPIGTRFGNKIYPYRKYGLYYDYNGRNPYRIYKGSTPYLYLTRDSGIQKVGDPNSLISSGLEMPINENVADEYKIIAMQLAIRLNADTFPTSPTQIFEIQGKDSYTKFFLVANDFTGKRGRIYAVNSNTGQVENGIAFYLNGKLVREPVISLESWSFLGINFQKSVDLNGYVGAFRITGPMLTNLVSIYKSTNLQEVQKSTYRPWSLIKTSSLQGDLSWLYWKSAFTWNSVLVAASLDYYGIDPSTIYKIYTGTNKLIMDDSRQIKVNSYEYGIYSYGATNAKIINAV